MFCTMDNTVPRSFLISYLRPLRPELNPVNYVREDSSKFSASLSLFHLIPFYFLDLPCEVLLFSGSTT